jgi:eukaryotic translation initiation factor 2-alpha kinase 4
MMRLEKISSPIIPTVREGLEKIQEVIDFAKATGVDKELFIRPLFLSREFSSFEDGVVIGVVKKSKPSDILAFGGRYNHLITQYAVLQSKSRAKNICACVLQIDLEEIKDSLAKFQRNSINTLVKDERSFGFWSPRRCDVYIVSQQAGFLKDRLDVVGELWQNSISADIMYEAGLDDAENYMDMCAREGILYVFPRFPDCGWRVNSLQVHSISKVQSREVTFL